MKFSLIPLYNAKFTKIFLFNKIFYFNNLQSFFYSSKIKNFTKIKMNDVIPKNLVKHKPSKAGSSQRPSVWTEFITLANACNAVNLGQGFPDTPMPSTLTNYLKEIASHPERTDWHQYTRVFGHIPLVNALAKLYSKTLEVELDGQNNIIVTVGAYLALYYSFVAWLNPGDEVLLFEPAYDCYVEQILIAGGIPVPIVLKYQPDSDEISSSKAYKIDFDEIRKKITSKTKMLVLNNPNNPLGKVYTLQELEALAEIAKNNNLIVVSDEVYEYHVFPPNKMIRFASLPGMFNQTITIGSAGKCFSATGWKIGWAIAPSWLLQPLKKIHEQCVFTVSTPTQQAIACQLEDEIKLLENNDEESKKKSYLFFKLWNELLPKRDALAKYLRAAGFKPIIPDGGYFMMTDFGHLDGSFKNDNSTNDPLDYKFVRWLCKEKKLAAIPPSAFYSQQNRKENDHYIRFCFFKKTETLNAAIKILEEFATK